MIILKFEINTFARISSYLIVKNLDKKKKVYNNSAVLFNSLIYIYSLYRPLNQISPILFRAKYLSFCSYCFLFYFNNFAASTFAGDYKFGSTNIEVTLTNTAYIVNTGFHFSDNFY